MRDAGSTIVGTATTVSEASALEAAGVDVVVAQGWEAGGHRGTFERPTGEVEVGVLALVPQVVDAVSVPVLAAGAVMDGRGIAAVLALGAAGASLGTAFIAAAESSAPPAYRRLLAATPANGTIVSRVFSGRDARLVRTDAVEELVASGVPPADYPLQLELTRPIHSSGLDHDDPARLFALAGQGAALARELPAAELLATLVAETDEAVHRLAPEAVDSLPVMNPDFRKVALIAAALGLLLSLFFALRPGDDNTTAQATTAETTTAQTTTEAPPATTEAPPATTEAPPATTSQGPETVRLEYVIVGGKPQGGISRDSVSVGTNVVVNVTSDVADEVHVHGYDLMADVAPGRAGDDSLQGRRTRPVRDRARGHRRPDRRARGSPLSLLAHGIGGVKDLPVPNWLFFWGAAVVLVFSFLALGALWKKPQFERRAAGRPLPAGLERVLRSTALRVVARRSPRACSRSSS